MSYIIVSEYLCDCIGHVNIVSVSKKKRQRKVKKGKEVEKGREAEAEAETETEEEVGIMGWKCLLVGAQELKTA